MNKITLKSAWEYLQRHWLLLSIAAFITGGFIYYMYAGNQFCDCATTEKFQDGTSRSGRSGGTYFRYYHK